MINDFSQEANQLILAYTKIWGLLLAFDKGALKLLKQVTLRLKHEVAQSVIEMLEAELSVCNEATYLF